MSDTITAEQYKYFLESAPTNILDQAGNDMAMAAQRLPENSCEFQELCMMLAMLISERQLREIEPLWRKARRFAMRNSRTITELGKIAACIGAGVILGVSLDDGTYVNNI
jgi:hypothetical protein